MTDRTDSDPLDALLGKAATDEDLREALLRDPKGTIQSELGITVPDDVDVEVLEESPAKVYLVLPYMSGEISEEALSEVAGGLQAYARVKTRMTWARTGTSASLHMTQTGGLTR